MAKTAYIPNSLFNIIKDNKVILHNDNILQVYKIVDMLNYFGLRSGERDWSYISIKAQTLKDRWGKDYKKYLEFLINNNFLESTNSYIVNEYTIKYRCTPKYFLDDFKSIEVTEKKLKNFSFTYNDKVEELNEYINLYHDIFNFRIDNTVYTWLNNNKEIDNSVRNFIYSTVECLNSKILYFHVDKQRRLHTNITTLKKHVRENYLLINNRSVMEIDIKNCQPSLVSKMMIKDGIKNDKFISDTSNGIIYDRVLFETKLENRKEAKIFTYKILFGDNTINNKFNKAFACIYPKAWEWIKWKKEKLGSYELFSQLLQLKEAEFVFDNLLPIFRKKYPNNIFATVHDSIITEKSDMYKLMYNEANKLFKNYDL